MQVKTLILTLCLIAPLTAMAQTSTPRETTRLERGQAHVQRMEDRAKADGVVTKGERARLTQAENVESRRIRRQKHDRQTDFNHNGVRDGVEARAARSR